MSQRSKKETKDTLTETSINDLAYVVAYFDNNMNQTRAYMSLHPEAGYNSARTLAARVYAKVDIRDEIRRRLDEKAMSAEEAVARIGEIARADLHPFVRIDDEGFAYFNFANPQARAYLFLIKKIKTKRERHIEGLRLNGTPEEWEGEWIEVELHDSHAALRDILKMHGKLTDRVDVTSKGESLAPKISDEERLSRMKELAAVIAEELKKNA